MTAIFRNPFGTTVIKNIKDLSYNVVFDKKANGDVLETQITLLDKSALSTAVVKLVSMKMLKKEIGSTLVISVNGATIC